MYYKRISFMCNRSSEEFVAHLVLLQHHEVKVPQTLLGIFTHAFGELCMIHDVADVLIYERIPAEVLVSVEPKTLWPRTSQYLTQPLNQTPSSPSTPPQCWHVVYVAC